jgi:hypothetical protein
MAVTACASDGRPGTVQLADEITRRLRRMHVQVLRDADLRPYDPAGELC